MDVLLKTLVKLLMTLALAGCVAHGEAVVVPVTKDATLHDILFATNRVPNNQLYGNVRSNALSFGEICVSVPSGHRLGVVEYPDKSPDPQTNFGIVAAATTVDPRGFDQMLDKQISKRAKGERNAIVYVHGFNNSFAEALYMNAQLLHDYKRKDIPVMFSWPSAGENFAYLHDRDSIMFSRSALETLLDQLQASNIESFSIVGHSIGSQLVVEVLRQRAIRNNGAQWSKLRSTALVSPDIDVELFEQQAIDMGGLPQPFFVIASENDRLLQLSGILSGSNVRLGAIGDADRLDASDATLMSATFAADIWSSNHTTAFQSRDMIELLRAFAPSED
ncbi:MAG: esterase/lipase superfamily enzyme [Ascidiaceihabitans sp.]